MSALQDSLHGTDYGFALPSQEDTALHHTRSPRCSGSLLRGSLAITTTGLSPVSHQNLSRRTKPLFDYQGPFRIVAPHDKRGARSIRMLQRLEVVRLVK